MFILIFSLDGKLIPLVFFLNISFFLFLVGLVGIIWNKQNFLIMLICSELMFFSLVLNFIFLSLFTYSYIGQTFALIILIMTAIESVIGLSLLILAYSLSDKLSYNSLNILRG